MHDITKAIITGLGSCSSLSDRNAQDEKIQSLDGRLAALERLVNAQAAGH